jgi:protocatechuate 3,4-dioxygenase beta subunit
MQTNEVPRRRMLQLLGGAGLLALASCASKGGTNSSSTPTTGASSPTSSGGSPSGTIPEETAGPFPGDGSNGANALAQAGVVRKDIRSSFGSASGTADGVPTTIRFTLTDSTGAPMNDAAVYVWHCDREGRYSMYSDGATDQNYLRGVQPADSGGVVTFTSIYPACYSGRWPHVHFEVYPGLEAATDPANRIATSQIALPEDICHAVYATDGYASSIQTLSRVSLTSDMVFGNDGGIHQIGAISGSIDSGLTVELPVAVRAE